MQAPAGVFFGEEGIPQNENFSARRGGASFRRVELGHPVWDDVQAQQTLQDSQSSHETQAGKKQAIEQCLNVHRSGVASTAVFAVCDAASSGGLGDPEFRKLLSTAT